jgi:hypothetical protein
MTSAMNPMAPAPTDEIETTTPTKTPATGVKISAVRGSISLSLERRALTIRSRSANTPAVTIKAKQRTIVIRLPAAWLFRSMTDNRKSVATVAGRLPDARRLTIAQSMLRASP